MALLKRLHKFNPLVSHFNVFATTVIERYVANILEHCSAAMRTYRRNGGSLNLMVDDGDGNQIELAATIPDDEHSRRTGQSPQSKEELSDMVQDLTKVIAQLPPYLRKVCSQLKQKSATDVAKSMGISRSRLYELINQIRRRFERSDLRDYLK